MNCTQRGWLKRHLHEVWIVATRATEVALKNRSVKAETCLTVGQPEEAPIATVPNAACLHSIESKLLLVDTDLPGCLWFILRRNIANPQRISQCRASARHSLCVLRRGLSSGPQQPCQQPHNTHYDNNGHADHDTTAFFTAKSVLAGWRGDLRRESRTYGEGPKQVARMIASYTELSNAVRTLAVTMMIAP